MLFLFASAGKNAVGIEKVLKNYQAAMSNSLLAATAD
jgi:hypothetical protein